MSNKSSAVTRKKKLVYDMDLAKKELVDLKLLSNADLFTLANDATATGSNWGLGDIGTAESPSDIKGYINNMSNGVNYFNIYMSSLNQVEQIIRDMKALKESHADANTSAAQKEVIATQYAVLLAELKTIQSKSKVNGVAAYATSATAALIGTSGADEATAHVVSPTSTYEISYGTTATAKVSHKLIDPYTVFTGSLINAAATVPAVVIDGVLTAVQAEILAASTDYEKAEFLKAMLSNQYDFIMSGMAEYRDVRAKELNAQIEKYTRGIEMIDSLYGIKFFS